MLQTKTDFYRPRILAPDDAITLDPFFDLSPDLLCIAGYDGYFKRINPAVSNLLGYSEDELYTRPINDFVYEADKDVTAKGRENLTKDIPLLNFENRYVKKSGEIVWLSWTSMPLAEKGLVYAIAKNVTHKKRQEEDRNDLIENLTKINSDLKQLTYTASHDLRSPVNNLLSVFSLLDVSKITDEETLQFIEVLKMATENLKETLNTYVDILGQKDKANTGIESVNFDEALSAVLYSLSSLMKNANASIKADFSDLAAVTFNRTYLESIFLNLLTNSIKYAHPDRAPLIFIQSQRQDGFSQLIYTDNGLGFDMDKVKDRIFGLHQKFHSHNDSKGIGLYLVYNHITGLGGTITVESKPNEGVKFILTFKE